MFEEKNLQKTPISQFGEFGLIEHLTKKFTSQKPETKLAVGDDAAIIDFSDYQTIVSTDLLIENIHFNLAYTPLKHLGYKAIVANISDVAAMNATPTHILVSIAVSNRFPVEALEEIYDGIYHACKTYNIDLIGGDTTSSQQGLMISVTILGKEKPENIVTRKGAQDKDLIVVSGDLGAAYLGLQVLERENITYKSNPNFQPDLIGYEYLLQRQLKPEARTDVKKILSEHHIIPTSMIDISDGLASEILHLAKQSNKGFHIYEEKIPMDASVMRCAEEFNFSATTAALNGGEDYELLFTANINHYKILSLLPDFTIIGYVSEAKKDSTLILSGSEQEIPLQAQGWKHFE